MMIISAAIKRKDGKLFVGACHADCFSASYEIDPENHDSICETQGFITDEGKFLDREEAYEYVMATGQKISHRLGTAESGFRLESESFHQFWTWQDIEKAKKLVGQRETSRPSAVYKFRKPTETVR